MPSRIYHEPGTATAFQASGGDIAWTFTSVATNNGRISDVWDRGAGAQPALYYFQAVASPNAGGSTLGNRVELYLLSSTNGTDWESGITIGNAATSNLELRRNARLFGSIIVDNTTAASLWRCSGVVEIFSRYVGVLGFNLSGTTLSGTAANNAVRFTPVAPVVVSA